MLNDPKKKTEDINLDLELNKAQNISQFSFVIPASQYELLPIPANT